MYEGLNPRDDFGEDTDFDHVTEHVVPANRISIDYNGQSFTMTPENSSVRLFDGKHSDYSRLIVDIGDGSLANVKLDDDTLVFLANCGFPTERPDTPNETDAEFMDGYMEIWTADANAELENLL